jgi:hypothetical protein
MDERMTNPDPIAVVGIGCRFPGGVATGDEYWDLLLEGRDASGPAPAQRWREYADRGPSYAAAVRGTLARGSFLTGVEDFDAEFFGISPREAELMDPQQRLAMETAWEALEHAGYRRPRWPAPTRVHGRLHGRLRAPALGGAARHRGVHGYRGRHVRRGEQGVPTHSTCVAPASPWTPRAPPHWSRFTWPARLSMPAKRTWRWRVEST